METDGENAKNKDMQQQKVQIHVMNGNKNKSWKQIQLFIFTKLVEKSI